MEIDRKEPCLCDTDYPAMVLAVSICQTLPVFQALFQVSYTCHSKHAKQSHYDDRSFTEEKNHGPRGSRPLCQVAKLAMGAPGSMQRVWLQTPSCQLLDMHFQGLKFLPKFEADFWPSNVLFAVGTWYISVALNWIFNEIFLN